jgi:hypothetical protein
MKSKLPPPTLTLEQIADILVQAWPDAAHAASVSARLGKPDPGWRALDQLEKENGGSRRYVDEQPVTRALLKKRGVAYHTREDRQRIVAAWQIARRRLRPPVPANASA